MRNLASVISLVVFAAGCSTVKSNLHCDTGKQVVAYASNEAQMQAAGDNALPCYQFGHGHVDSSTVSDTGTTWKCTDGKTYTVKR
jgi:hypothetical protein